MMDWYVGHDGGDLVVPKEQEYFDRLPSPDSWSQWGNGEFGNIESWSNDFDSEKSMTNLPEQRSQQRTSCGRVNFKSEGDQCSFGSRGQGVSSQDSFQRNSDHCGRSEYNFDELMEGADDLFMSSLLQDVCPSGGAHNHNSFGHPTQSQCCTDSDSASMMLEYQSMSSDADVMGNSKCFRTPPFSPASLQLLETTDMHQSDSMRYGDEDSSVEESVLLGLEAVMSQLSDKMRLCFRDSLYRLAHRSVQVEGQSPMLETTDEQMRSTTGNTESTTNTIDRAVANLMFNKVNENLQEDLTEHQGQTFAPGSNYGSSHKDSTVPIFRQQNPRNPSSSISSCGAEGLF